MGWESKEARGGELGWGGERPGRKGGGGEAFKQLQAQGRSGSQVLVPSCLYAPRHMPTTHRGEEVHAPPLLHVLAPLALVARAAEVGVRAQPLLAHALWRSHVCVCACVCKCAGAGVFGYMDL